MCGPTTTEGMPPSMATATPISFPQEHTCPDLFAYGKEGTVTVTKVIYERLYNLGNYENERLSAETQVLPDETPADAYNRARAAVEEEHRARQSERQRQAELQHEIYVAERQLSNVRAEATKIAQANNQALQQVQDMAAFLEQHGVKPTIPANIQTMLETKRAQDEQLAKVLPSVDLPRDSEAEADPGF
jgi:septal ring factor EnvC (AmiA/AmiB activator)